jgi:hypothetical protein
LPAAGHKGADFERGGGKQKGEHLMDFSQTLRYIRLLAPDQEEKARGLLASLPPGWEQGIPRQSRYLNGSISKLVVAHALLELLLPGTTAPSHAVRALAVYIHELYKLQQKGEHHER